MEELDAKGLIYFPEGMDKRFRQRFLDESQDELFNLWTDITAVNSQAKEDTSSDSKT